MVNNGNLFPSPDEGPSKNTTTLLNAAVNSPCCLLIGWEALQ